MAGHRVPTLFSTDLGQHPFLQSLHKEIDRVFDRFRDGDEADTDDLLSLASGRMVPALDIAESDASVEITADLPGMTAEDIDVSITDGVLVIEGEKSLGREEKEKDYHLVERRHGSFRRSVPLGFTPEEGKVQAQYKDGVLTLRIDKPASAVTKTQKVAISSS